MVSTNYVDLFLSHYFVFSKCNPHVPVSAPAIFLPPIVYILLLIHALSLIPQLHKHPDWEAVAKTVRVVAYLISSIFLLL